jgi:hypothetical protein
MIFFHLLDKLLMINGEIYQQLLQEWKAALDEGNIELAGSLAARTILLAESNLSDTLYAGQAMGIIRQVREYNYRQLLDESDLLIQQDAIPEALGKLQEAAELAATFEIPESPVYSELLSRVYKPVLLEKLSKGRMHAWLNDLDLAQGILDECLDIAVRYGLDRDPEISEVLDGLRSMIREKKNANNP